MMEDFVKVLVSWKHNTLLGPKIICRTLGGTILAECVVDNTFLSIYTKFGMNYFQTYQVVYKDISYPDIYKALADIPLEDFTTTTEFTIIIMNAELPMLKRSCAGQRDEYIPNTMATVFKKAYDLIQIQCHLGCYLFPKSKIPPDIMAQYVKEDDDIIILEKVDLIKVYSYKDTLDDFNLL